MAVLVKGGRTRTVANGTAYRIIQSLRNKYKYCQRKRKILDKQMLTQGYATHFFALHKHTNIKHQAHIRVYVREYLLYKHANKRKNKI